jgi:hypothetical protein
MGCNETAPRGTPNTWVRRASRMAVAAACTVVILRATGAAAMTEDECQKLAMDALVQAVDQGVCTLDVQPSAGPPQVADNGTTGEHGGGAGGGGGSGGSGGGGSGGGGDDGGDNGGDDGGSGGDDGGSGGDNGGSSGGDDGHGHDHGHGHGHGGHSHGGHGHGGCGD